MSIAELSPNATIAPAAKDYFADYSAWSQSMLKTFLERRRLAEAYYINRSAVEPEPTDPMRKGTAVHTALLEPEKFDDLIRIYPANILAKNGAVSTNEAYAFRDEHEAAGRMVFKEKDVATIRAMCDSVRRVCGKWLALPSIKEQSIYWVDAISELRCKARIDWLIERPDRDFIFDLKTTADASPRAFRKQCEDRRYWFQGEHYTAGVQAVRKRPTAFIFVAVESKFPHATSLHDFDAEAIENATNARRATMTEVSHCLKTNDWAEPWERHINTMQIREWAFEPNSL